MTNLYAENKDYIDSTTDRGINSENPILVDINNISHWFYSHERDEFNENEECILNLPWVETWFEFQLPKNRKYRGKTEHFDITHTFGIYSKNIDGKNCYYVYTDWKIEEDFGLKYDEPGKVPAKDIRFLGIVVRDLANLDKQFPIISPNYLMPLSPDPSNPENFLSLFIGEILLSVYFSTTFLHCNNVEYYEKSHPEKLQRANKKRGKKRQEVYKVLDIGQLKKQSKSQSGDNEDELRTALHICRGHFKTYTEENKLFGKYTGTYWWPMHKRGSKEHGEIKKDYKI